MRRRASITVVTLLLGCQWLTVSGEGGNVQTRRDKHDGAAAETGRGAGKEMAAKTGALMYEGILERATRWLSSERDADGGWSNDTHRVLLALRMANMSREDKLAPISPLELQISAKQMELEIVLLLWRHREIGFSPVRLARYTLALNAMCIDPRRFYGHDLIGSLQHHEPATDYEFALTTLSVCSAQAHVRKRQIRRLLDIANAAQDHKVDTVAMAILALRCIVQDHRHRNLQHFIRKPSVALAQQQRPDGSFGDLHGTALVLQALEESENESAANWNRTSCLDWLVRRQAADGSFAADLRLTAEVVLALAPRGLSTLRTLHCGHPKTEPARSTTTDPTTGNLEASGNTETQPPPSAPPAAVSSAPAAPAAPPATPALPVAAVSQVPQVPQVPQASPIGTTGPSSTGEPLSSTVAVPPQMVNVSYTLWVGTNVNEAYSLTVTAPKNETFYGVMLLAADMSPHFEFGAADWPNNHYIHTLAGYKEEPMSYHYWLLYRLPSPPDPSSPPGNQFVAPGGVNELQISEGEHYLYWYKKL